jgi:hypothetical protein
VCLQKHLSLSIKIHFHAHFLLRAVMGDVKTLLFKALLVLRDSLDLTGQLAPGDRQDLTEKTGMER